MKKLLSIILAVVMVLGSMTFVMAADDIKITINGEAKTFDVMPQIIEGRTLVPMRGIFEALGAEVGWDDATKTATGKTASTTVSLTIDKKDATVNGKTVTLDVPAQIIDSRTMVPARFVAESLGCKVDWNDATKTVIITKEEAPAPAPAVTGWKELAKVTFESKNPAPATGINIWGKKADNSNSDGSFSYVNYSDIASIGKPNTTDDFGSVVLKAASKAESVKGLYEGRINDFKTDVFSYEAGKKYKMSMWACLGETAKGGNKASITFKVYSGTKSDAFGASKKFTLEKGKWTLLETEYTVDAAGATQTTGTRFAFAATTSDDFPTVIYMDNLKFEVYSEGGESAPTPAPTTPETPKKEEAPKPVAGAEKILDASLPQSGTVIVTQKDFATCADGKAIVDKDGVITISATKKSSDNGFITQPKVSLSGIFKKDNVYMLTFKARLVSGSPYLKAFIQSGKETNYAKPIFAATSYGKEWTTCYMPFVGIKEDMDGGWGFRLAGETHTTEIKDFQIIDYGTSVKVTDLPHTYIVVGNTAVNGIKLQ